MKVFRATNEATWDSGSAEERWAARRSKERISDGRWSTRRAAFFILGGSAAVWFVAGSLLNAAL